MEAWQDQPDPDNEKALVRSIDAYAAQIRKECASIPLPLEETQLDIIFGSGGSTTVQVLREASSAAMAIAGVTVPQIQPVIILPIIIQLGRSGYSIYVWNAKRPRKTTITLTSTNAGQEAHIPTARPG